MALHTTCDGVKRRDFLKVGALGATGLGLANYLQLSAQGAVQTGKATSAIFVNLPKNFDYAALFQHFIIHSFFANIKSSNRHRFFTFFFGIQNKVAFFTNSVLTRSDIQFLTK